MKFAKAKPKENNEPQIDIAIPFYGYKSHISIDRRHGLIRRSLVTDAAAHDGARLRGRYTIVAITHRPAWTRIADQRYNVEALQVTRVEPERAASPLY